MTREEILALLLYLLPPAHPERQHDLRLALWEIVRTTPAARLMALQRGLEGMKKERGNE